MNTDLLKALNKKIGISDEQVAEVLVKRRRVPLLGKIDQEGADYLIESLIMLDCKEKAEIELLISSEGGTVRAAESIQCVIGTLHSPVKAIVLEKACSAAIDVLLACEKRVGLPQSKFMVHYSCRELNVVHDSHEIPDSEIAIITRQLIGRKKEADEYYAKRMGKSVEEIRELCRLGQKYDVFYTSEEAKKLGLIQEIVSDFKIFDGAQTDKK